MIDHGLATNEVCLVALLLRFINKDRTNHEFNSIVTQTLLGRAFIRSGTT